MNDNDTDTFAGAASDLESSSTGISSISEVSCPCNKAEKGHFIENSNRYGCATCSFWLPAEIGKYKLSPQDVYDMLYGDRVGPVSGQDRQPLKDVSGNPVLARWTDFHEFVGKEGKKYKASLALDTNAKIIRRFPDKAPVEQTGRLCPECQENGRKGMLVIRTSSKDDSKFVACNAFPKCKYTEPYTSFALPQPDTTADAVPTNPEKVDA